MHQKKKWKPPVYIYVILFLAGTYIAFVCASCRKPGMTTGEYLRAMSEFVTTSPFSFSFSDIAANIRTFGIAVMIIYTVLGLYILIDVTKIRDYMPGEEYGTMSWATVEKINKKFENLKNPHANRIYSEGIRISMDGKKTRINNNVLGIGGSGAGKSLFLLTPNLYQADSESRYPGSFIITDPKGELLEKNGRLLKQKGYHVRVINLVPGRMHESDHFNPFRYIKTETDIVRLINNLFANTTPKDARSGDPFWEKSEMMFLQALCLLVWMDHERYGWEMSFNTVMDLMNMAVVDEDKESPLDEIFERLKFDTKGEPGKGANHPAYIAYRNCISGAADTIRSIFIMAKARMTIFQNPDIRKILSDDELDLTSLGTGIIDGKKNQKTVLFCVIPDWDTSYNCIAGMVYTLAFQELFFQADMVYGGTLPIPVTFWMDEFANIALPSEFLKMLGTMRSRGMSAVILIQNLAQIKGIYKDDWETIPGNCDVSVYLGGNEPSTFKYISENLGKKTIHKKNQTENQGGKGTIDVMQRDLMMPDEVRELDNDYAVIFVRGMKPILDRKYRTFDSPDYALSKQLGSYMHSQDKKMDEGLGISPVPASMIDKDARIIRIDLSRPLFVTPESEELEAIINENNEEAKIMAANHVDITDMSLEEVLSDEDFTLTDEEMLEVTAGIKHGLTDSEIKSYILFRDAGRMKAQRELIEALKMRKAGTVA